MNEEEKIELKSFSHLDHKICEDLEMLESRAMKRAKKGFRND
jgi:hypothetical protein